MRIAVSAQSCEMVQNAQRKKGGSQQKNGCDFYCKSDNTHYTLYTHAHEMNTYITHTHRYICIYIYIYKPQKHLT